MNSKNVIWIIAIVILAVITTGAVGVVVYFAKKDSSQSISPTNGPAVSSFEECVAAGYPVMESYPRQCRTPQGQTFAEDVGNELDKQDLIRVTNPRPNATIQSPLSITGEARGTWFFEATFPVRLLDIEGQAMATGFATAQGEWMTENFVPFTAELKFSVTSTIPGTLILEKDNPSGLPEHADELWMPVTIQP